MYSIDGISILQRNAQSQIFDGVNENFCRTVDDEQKLLEQRLLEQQRQSEEDSRWLAREEVTLLFGHAFKRVIGLINLTISENGNTKKKKIDFMTKSVQCVFFSPLYTMFSINFSQLFKSYH